MIVPTITRISSAPSVDRLVTYGGSLFICVTGISAMDLGCRVSPTRDDEWVYREARTHVSVLVRPCRPRLAPCGRSPWSSRPEDE